MNLSKVQPGDLVTVNVDSAPSGSDAPDTTYVAWVIDLNVRRRWNEDKNGEFPREVRVEPAVNPAGRANSTYYFVTPRQIVGHAPWQKGSRRPERIDKLLRDWDPEDEAFVLGGVVSE
jgi:hypothetical protein